MERPIWSVIVNKYFIEIRAGYTFVVYDRGKWTIMSALDHRIGLGECPEDLTIIVEYEQEALCDSY